MLGSLKKASNFYTTYFIFLVIGVSFFLYQENGDFVLALNGLHNIVLNYFFRVWTYGGDGVFFAVVAVWLLFTNRKYGYVFLVVGLIQGSITFLMKQVVFVDSPRPKIFFEGQRILHYVEGVDVLSFSSFPSGHTVSAFSTACFLALMYQSKSKATLLALAAILVGISRIYLVQHFLIDIVAGSLIGVLVATSVFIFSEGFLLKKKSSKEENDSEIKENYSVLTLPKEE
ncbi:MAG: phosphatase PAP2 family protein [Ekhidna sp.]